MNQERSSETERALQLLKETATKLMTNEKHWLESFIVNSFEVTREVSCTYSDLRLLDAGEVLRDQFKGTEYELLALAVYNTCNEIYMQNIVLSAKAIVQTFDEKKHSAKMVSDRKKHSAKMASSRYKESRRLKEAIRAEYKANKNIYSSKMAFAEEVANREGIKLKVETVYKTWINDL